MTELKKLSKILILLLFLIIVGTVGYTALLDISPLKALYMTVITISTVGYKEVAVMTPQAEVFSIFIIFWGIGVVGYALSSLALMFVEGHIQKFWRGRVMEKKIKKMQNHYIICGMDEVSEEIIKELTKEEKEYVLIDEDLENIQVCLERGFIAYHGSSVNEDDLRAVGIENASGIVAVHKKDVDNIVTVLTARDLNNKLNIVSLAHERMSEEKLKRVGADNVLSTSQIGGRRLAALLTKPHIISFLDVLTKFGNMEYDLEEVHISSNSDLTNLTLADAKIPTKTGLIVFAVKKAGADMIMNPSGSLKLESDDVLLVMGREEQIIKLRELAK